MSAPGNLVTIRPGLTLQAPAAASWRRAESVLGKLDVNSSYRDWGVQYKAWQAYHAYISGNGPWAPYALHPDLSWHCKGLAVDSDDAQRLHVTLSEYGWIQTALAVKEWWHLDYIASRDKHVGEVAGGGSKPLPIPTPTPMKELDMHTIYYRTADGKIYALETATGAARHLSPTEWTRVNEAYKAAGLKVPFADEKK